MRVQIVDPPAYTPPYDRSLAAALAAAGAEVQLVTSRFAHGEVPEPQGYVVREDFYRRSRAAGFPRALRRAGQALEHPGDMLRLRRTADSAVHHYQWLTLPRLDWALLPPARPRILTPHGWLRREGWREHPGRGLRRLLDSMDAVVALSDYGASRLIEAGVSSERVRVIPHGAFDYLTRLPDPAPLAPELAATEPDRQVILAFGLVRPYKGTDLLIDAMRELPEAELWIVGRPLGLELDELRARAASVADRVRFVPRFVSDREIPAIFQRADVVALPYRDAEQSGVLYTALAFGKPIVVSDAGGFPELAALGAARMVTAGDADQLRDALAELLTDAETRERLAAAAAAAAAGRYSWQQVAAAHMNLYRDLLGD